MAGHGPKDPSSDTARLISNTEAAPDLNVIGGPPQSIAERFRAIAKIVGLLAAIAHPKTAEADPAIIAAHAADSPLRAHASGPSLVDLKTKWGVELTLPESAGLDSTAGAKAKFPEINVNIIERDPATGRYHVALHDLWSAVCPISLVTVSHKTQRYESTFTIPYEYARQFDLARSLRPEDHDRFAADVRAQLLHQVADELHGFDWAKAAYRRAHGPELLHDSTVDSLTAVGNASPEGPAALGPESLSESDPENEDLGALRGDDAAKRIMNALQESSPMRVRVIGRELGFSDEDWGRLTELSMDYSGATEDERIFTMVKAYCAGRIKDPELNRELAEIIYSKRRVDATVQGHVDHDSKALYPIPLGLLFLLRRRQRQQESGDPSPDQATGGDPNRGDAAGLRSARPTATATQSSGGRNTATSTAGQSVLQEEASLPSRIKETDLPGIDSDEYRAMRRETLLNDILIFFDGPGVNYRELTEQIQQQRAGLSPRQVEDLLTYRILRAWENCDREKLAKGAIRLEENSELQSALDYCHTPEKIRWARMHARILLGAAEERQQPGNPGSSNDLLDLLTRKALQILRGESKDQGRL
ncbi:MAG: hypothetical protein K1X83_06955 [Oligoflexia bacterium]|nr:hypothetical protein [Oligoflexia bacterium]